MGWDKPTLEWNVLITGASSGIGAAIARRFASCGCTVIINYRNSHEKAEQVANDCNRLGGTAILLACDISVAEQVEQMYNTLTAMHRLPDVIVNNAGISHFGLLTDTDESDWDRIFSTNVKSSFLLAKQFTPHMVNQKYGRMINISSVWGISGASCEVAYAASKGALNAFTKSLARELAPSEITVNAVAPGMVDTEMNARLTDDEYQQLVNDIPAGRTATPDEIAALVYFLATPESAYINGQIISPNGAWLT